MAGVNVSFRCSLIEKKPDEEVDTLNQEPQLPQPSGDDSSSEHPQIVQCSFPCVPPTSVDLDTLIMRAMGTLGQRKPKASQNQQWFIKKLDLGEVPKTGDCSCDSFLLENLNSLLPSMCYKDITIVQKEVQLSKRLPMKLRRRLKWNLLRSQRHGSMSGAKNMKT